MCMSQCQGGNVQRERQRQRERRGLQEGCPPRLSCHQGGALNQVVCCPGEGGQEMCVLQTGPDEKASL